jgi:hypothetical protein
MKPRKSIAIALLLLLAAAQSSVRAGILFAESVTIVFSRAIVPEGVTWSSSMQLKDDRLETNPVSAPNQFWDFWVQSQYIPVGLSWRPPTGIRIKLSLNGEQSEGINLGAYFRYSSDKVHWSSWYNLARIESEKDNPAMAYQGNVYLPRAAGERYMALMQQWWKTDPDWSSDEHEFCLWLARHHREFFTRERPFIGYIQLRLEGNGNRFSLADMKIDTSWAVSGLHSIPKGKQRETSEEKWFFDLNKYN